MNYFTNTSCTIDIYVVVRFNIFARFLKRIVTSIEKTKLFIFSGGFIIFNLYINEALKGVTEELRAGIIYVLIYDKIIDTLRYADYNAVLAESKKIP